MGSIDLHAHFKGAEVPGTEMTPLRLSLLDAILYSLKGNREIGVVAYEPKQNLLIREFDEELSARLRIQAIGLTRAMPISGAI